MPETNNVTDSVCPAKVLRFSPNSFKYESAINDLSSTKRHDKKFSNETLDARWKSTRNRKVKIAETRLHNFTWKRWKILVTVDFSYNRRYYQNIQTNCSMILDMAE